MGKLLTFIYTGRNDAYMGNFIYRVTTTLNFLAWNVARLGRQAEVDIRVADWGSDIPLSEALELSPEAAEITRFHYIPPALCRTLRADGDFSPSLAANVALRRCTSKFMLCTETDCLLPLSSLQALLSVLDGTTEIPFELEQTMFFCPRRQIPWEVVQREPGLAFWDRFLWLNAGSIPLDNHSAGLGGSGAGQAVTRDLWHAIHGYSEQLVGQGWIDVDLALRVTQDHPVLDLAAVGVCMYHMEHWPRNKRRARWMNSVINPYHVSLATVENPDTWGMGGQDIELQAPSRIVPLRMASDGPRAAPVLKSQALASPSISHLVRSLMPRFRVSLPEWESLCALAWHAAERFPLRYVEFDAQTLMGAAVVGGACIGTEIYAIDTWQGKQKLSSPAHLTAALDRNGYRGYMRFVVGPSVKAFDAIRPQIETLDLACATYPPGSEWSSLLVDLAQRLAPEGMLVVRFPSDTARRVAWTAMLEMFPQYTHLRGASGRTQLLLAVQPETQENRVVDFGRPRLPLPRVILSKLLHYVKRAVDDPKVVLERLRPGGPR